MATPSRQQQPPPPLPPGRLDAPPRPWNTLERLKASLYAIWIVDAVLLVSLIAATRIHRHAFDTIGKETVPSIIAAQRIRSAVASMDANAANELVAKPGAAPQAYVSFAKNREEAAHALIAAAENITFGDSERIPIQRLQLALASYETAIQHARDLHERNDAATIPAYRAAAVIADNNIVPAAEELDKANFDVLVRTFNEEKTESIAMRTLVLLAGVLLVVVLIAVQGYVSSKTRRTLNAGLLASTIVSIIFVLYCLGTFTRATEHLKTAREDAFEPLHALWRTRALSYAANADQSRYLLDKAHAMEHEAAFNSKIGQLATLPEGNTYAQVASALNGWQKVNGFSGYLADVSSVITAEGQLPAARDALTRLGEWLEVDRKIRYLETHNNHAEAVSIASGDGPDDSNAKFRQYDQALGEAIRINRAIFEDSVRNGIGGLKYFESTSAIITVVIAFLAFLGLARRIQEYM